jgi:transcriptional regulator GlxA family with amidase domain
MVVRVAAIAADGISPLDIGAVAEVFGINRGLAEPWYELTLCAPEPGAIATRGELTINVTDGLEAVDHADLVVALPVESYLHRPPPSSVVEALATAYTRGARVASLCVGAFAVAAAGLLDGKEATTHWRFCSQLADTYPTVRVVPGRLFVDGGQVLTSGGVAAGIDLCLHIVRSDYGAEVANRLSRSMVTGPHRDGGQAQYIEHPIPDPAPEPIGVAMAWALTNLRQPLTIASLASKANMSARTFVRRFRDVTGTTPHQWVIAQRLELARRLLETTGLQVDQIARRAGFGSSLSLRQHFLNRLETTPSAYRRTFTHHHQGVDATASMFTTAMPTPWRPRESRAERDAT